MFKKIIAPVIICILCILYFAIFFFCILGATEISGLLKLLLLIVPLLFMGTVVYVLLERIKEIRSGEEDDLSKY